MLSDRCLSVCPVCNVGVLCQTVGWIKTPLGMEVGLGPGHIVLLGDPAPSPKNGHSPLLSQFWPMSVVANRLDGSRCHLARTTEKGLGAGHIVLDGEPAPPRKGAQQPPSLFSAHVYCGQAVAHLSHF